MSETETTLPDDMILAGEYVLGLLEGDDMEAAKQKLSGDRAFAAYVEAWERDLAGMAEQLAEVTPPARVRERLEAVLFASGEVTTQTRWWEMLTVWRWATAALAVLSLVLVISLINQPSPPERQVYAAAMSSEDYAGAILARIDLDAAEIDVKPFEVALDGRSAELWLIPEGQVPRSLGLIDPETGSILSLRDTDAPEIGPGALVAVSLEPEGGSTTGAPTGPIIAIGPLNEIS